MSRIATHFRWRDGEPRRRHGEYRWPLRDIAPGSGPASELHHHRLASWLFLESRGATATLRRILFLVDKAVFIPVRIQAKILQHLKIFFHRLIQRGQIV